jgi:HTH-type transcriptional regulator, sugar sensing transcriptional regulator
MSKLEEALYGAGLSEKEAKVYLASLELGGGTAVQIARKSGINRGTTYLIAENLMQRGLMSGVDREGSRHFCSEPPSHLVSRIEKENETLAARREMLATALPELEAIVKGSPARPVVRYYEGVGGLAVMREILYKNRREEILNALDMDAFCGAIPKDNIYEHFKNLNLYNVCGRVLYTCSDELNKKLLANLVNKDTWQHRRIEKQKYPFEGEIVIFGKTVAFLSYRNGVVGAIVEHASFAQTMRGIFELAWLGSK